jgi:thioredoxin 1
MADQNVQIFTDANFEQSVMSSRGAVLVDFWAAWCGPCLRMGPTIDALAQEYAGKLVVGKMNVDENPQTPERFQIRSIPTLLLFKGGQLVESMVGLMGKNELKKVVDKYAEQVLET